MNIDKDAKEFRYLIEKLWKILGKKMNESVGQIVETKIKNITDKAIFAELNNGLVGMIHFKEISYNENPEDLKKFKKINR